MRLLFICLVLRILCYNNASAQSPRKTESFDANWKFMLGDDSLAKQPEFNDSKWRTLDLPHDWSIEGSFDEKILPHQAKADYLLASDGIVKLSKSRHPQKIRLYLLILTAFIVTPKFG